MNAPVRAQRNMATCRTTALVLAALFPPSIGAAASPQSAVSNVAKPVVDTAKSQTPAKLAAASSSAAGTVAPRGDYAAEKARLAAELRKLEDLNREWQRIENETPAVPAATEVRPAEQTAAEKVPEATPVPQSKQQESPEVAETAESTPRAALPGSPLAAAIEEPARRSNCLYRLGKYKDALAGYQKLFKDFGKSGERPWIMYRIAMCHYRLGDPDKAEKGLRELIATCPNEYWTKQASAAVGDMRWWKLWNAIYVPPAPKASEPQE